MTIEKLIIETKSPSLHILRNDEIIARGVHFDKMVLTAEDGEISAISSKDTGVFVLFKGSHSVTTDKKYTKYVENGITTRELAFQSKNAAAQFVLGISGRTNHWKSEK